MIFSPPSWVPEIDSQIPDSVPLGEFFLPGDPTAGSPGSPSPAPFVDAISGKSYSPEELQARVECLARALSRRLGWQPNSGSPWDRVVAIHAFNTIDYFVACWAIHRLNGICMPIHSTSTVAEMASHLANGRCHAIFTCRGLASTSVQAAEKASIPLERVYTLPLPEAYIVPDDEPLKRFVSLEQLIDDASQIDPLEPLQWEPGQAKTQVAFLCPTSGTSGPQKLAMLTHYGVMLNILQVTAYEDYSKQGRGQVASGAIPFSHSYGLLIGHIALWRRDTLIVFPQFDMQHLLRTVSEFNITRLYLVPPILAALAANPFLLQMFDLSSVESVVTGAAPFDRAVAEKLHKHVPGWKFLHAYGLTETSIVATFTSAHDIWHGSSGSLVTGYQMRLVGPDGKDVSEYEEAGEVLFKAPNLFVGYLGNAKATKATIDPEGWHSTGDVGLVRVSPSGHEHLFIRDRIKDMIKVKGIQVVPIDIESVLREHPGVAEAAVIGIPDELAGERCCAFVVRSKTAMSEMEEDDLRDSIDDHVEEKLHETHWLSGRIHFLAEIPKSKNGKVLKKELRALGK